LKEVFMRRGMPVRARKAERSAWKKGKLWERRRAGQRVSRGAAQPAAEMVVVVSP
jgi:hypothetical protein